MKEATAPKGEPQFFATVRAQDGKKHAVTAYWNEKFGGWEFQVMAFALGIVLSSRYWRWLPAAPHARRPQPEVKEAFTRLVDVIQSEPPSKWTMSHNIISVHKDLALGALDTSGLDDDATIAADRLLYPPQPSRQEVAAAEAATWLKQYLTEKGSQARREEVVGAAGLAPWFQHYVTATRDMQRLAHVPEAQAGNDSRLLEAVLERARKLLRVDASVDVKLGKAESEARETKVTREPEFEVWWRLPGARRE